MALTGRSSRQGVFVIQTRVTAPGTCRGYHDEVDQTRMETAANDRNPTSRKRVMRVFDDDLVEVFAGGMSLA